MGRMNVLLLTTCALRSTADEDSAYNNYYYPAPERELVTSAPTSGPAPATFACEVLSEAMNKECYTNAMWAKDTGAVTDASQYPAGASTEADFQCALFLKSGFADGPAWNCTLPPCSGLSANMTTLSAGEVVTCLPPPTNPPSMAPTMMPTPCPTFNASGINSESFLEKQNKNTGPFSSFQWWGWLLLAAGVAGVCGVAIVGILGGMKAAKAKPKKTRAVVGAPAPPPAPPSAAPPSHYQSSPTYTAAPSYTAAPTYTAAPIAATSYTAPPIYAAQPTYSYQQLPTSSPTYPMQGFAQMPTTGSVVAGSVMAPPSYQAMPIQYNPAFAGAPVYSYGA